MDFLKFQNQTILTKKKRFQLQRKLQNKFKTHKLEFGMINMHIYIPYSYIKQRTYASLILSKITMHNSLSLTNSDVLGT